MLLVARRSGLVKGCMAAFAIATGQGKKLSRYEEGIDQLAIGLQIRDDLADVEEDENAGRWTYVISRLVEKGHSATARALVESGLMKELLDESISCLESAAFTLELGTRSSLAMYIRHLIAENTAIREGGLSQPVPKLEY